MSDNPPTPPIPVNPAVLADAALRYVIAGWPVLPLRLPAPLRSPDVSLRFLASHRPPTDTTTARDWWGGHHPYGIAAVVGVHFDVIAVPAHLGPIMLTYLRRQQVTAINHPGGWWLYLATPAAPTLDDLPRRSGITILRAGTYIPLPPTPTAAGPVEWAHRTTALSDLITPGPSGTALPHSMTVQQAAARAVATASPVE